MNKINLFTVSQLGKITLNQGSSSTPNKNAIIALQAECSRLGYKLSKEIVSVLKTYADSELKEFHKFLTHALSKARGSHVEHNPLFWKFPEEVKDVLLYKEKRMSVFFQSHFNFKEEGVGVEKLSCGCLVDEEMFDLSVFGACPICQQQTAGTKSKKVERVPLNEKVKLTTIKLISEEEAWNGVSNTLNSKVAFSPATQENLEIVFKNFPKEVLEVLPSSFTIKENMAYVAKLMMKNQVYADDVVENWTKTATDILRIAVTLSGGNPALVGKTNFKLNNIERRLVMRLLNHLATPQEDMLRHRQRWLRLGEYLHIGAYQKKFPQAFKSMQDLRENHKEIYTFNRHSEQVVKKIKEDGDPKAAIDLFSTRPGEFARKLDVLMRSSEKNEIIEAFSKVAPFIATPLLLKLNKSISTRTKASEFRSFMPKSDMGKLFVSEGDSRYPLTEDQVDRAKWILEGALKDRFSKKEKLNKVFISPSLKKVLVPFSQRSASKSLSTMERGSRLKFNKDTNVVRAFLYWKENEKSGRIDVDLSAIAFDENWNYRSHLSWTSLGNLDSVHSGDIQSAPQGASEFIDINIQSFLNAGIRYVLVNVRSFTGQAFNAFECFAGVMEREDVKSGEIFEPSTVKVKCDLAGETTGNYPMILDLEKGEIIWMDLAQDMKSGRSVETDRKGMPRLAKTIVALQNNLPNLFDLISLHAKARGAEVHTQKQADVTYDLVFDEEKSKDISDILANYL